MLSNALKKFLREPLFGPVQQLHKDDAPSGDKKKKRDPYDDDENTTVAGEDTTIQPDVKKMLRKDTHAHHAGESINAGAGKGGEHPAHEKAGELSNQARVASVIAGGSGKGASEKNHTEASKAHYKAADQYRRLAEQHENAGHHHTMAAEKIHARTHPDD